MVLSECFEIGVGVADLTCDSVTDAFSSERLYLLAMDLSPSIGGHVPPDPLELAFKLPIGSSSATKDEASPIEVIDLMMESRRPWPPWCSLNSELKQLLAKVGPTVNCASLHGRNRQP